MPIHHMAPFTQSFTSSSALNLAYMHVFGSGIKLEIPEETHTGMEKTLKTLLGDPTAVRWQYLPLWHVVKYD